MARHGPIIRSAEKPASASLVALASACSSETSLGNSFLQQSAVDAVGRLRRNRRASQSVTMPVLSYAEPSKTSICLGNMYACIGRPTSTLREENRVHPPLRPRSASSQGLGQKQAYPPAMLGPHSAINMFNLAKENDSRLAMTRYTPAMADPHSGINMFNLAKENDSRLAMATCLTLTRPRE
ncbi:hypothetical protein RJ55_05271 [Drechmeria coniospora]|nr:hypothetical protein RJ55_05271 [Drechmeria coniospora]